MPAIASGQSTGESTFKTRPSPQTNAHKIATSSAIENAVSDAQTIRACFSVGGGKLIAEPEGRARRPHGATNERNTPETRSLSPRERAGVKGKRPSNGENRDFVRESSSSAHPFPRLFDFTVAALTALISAARTPARSSSCNPSIVVPPG